MEKVELVPINRPPVLYEKMSAERKTAIFEKLRHAIPVFAKMRRDKIKKNCEFARLCILDAFQGRLSNGLANNSKKSQWIYTIFCIQTSDLLFKTVISACALHSLMIFFEPENACSSSVFMPIFQIAVVLIYCFDIALKMSYEGLEVSVLLSICAFIV